MPLCNRPAIHFSVLVVFRLNRPANRTFSLAPLGLRRNSCSSQPSRRGEKSLAIRVVDKNVPTAVSPAHHMINRTGLLEAQLARHVSVLTYVRLCFNSENRHLLRLGLCLATQPRYGHAKHAGSFQTRNQQPSRLPFGYQRCAFRREIAPEYKYVIHRRFVQNLRKPL